MEYADVIFNANEFILNFCWYCECFHLLSLGSYECCIWMVLFYMFFILENCMYIQKWPRNAHPASVAQSYKHLILS
jgi:hypothetical protein